MKRVFYFICCVSLLLSCTNEKKPAQVNAIKILVDESFAPIIDDQYIVFSSTYPQSKLDLQYKPEIHLLNTLLKDSADIAIMARKLLPGEAGRYERKGIKIKTNRLAIDAVALITHKSSGDTTITIDEIKALMQGRGTGKSLVFDNPNSSTVRYLKELAGVKSLPQKGIYALNSNTDVINYTHNNPGSIGVIGINWMKQPPVELESTVSNLKTLAVKNSAGLPGSDKFYKPSQNNLALGLYPLSRELYFIDCKGGTSGTAFAAFILGERGQRIILKSGLVPDSIPSREILIRKTGPIVIKKQ